MNIQQSFTPKEWRTLKFAPLWVFNAVADADDRINEREIAAFVSEVEEGDLYNEPLVREVFSSLLKDTEILDQYRADDRNMPGGLAEAAEILDRKVAPEHAEAFKKAILLVGRKVAEALGEDPFLSDRISDEEELSLFRIADILGTSLEEE